MMKQRIFGCLLIMVMPVAAVFMTGAGMSPGTKASYLNSVTAANINTNKEVITTENAAAIVTTAENPVSKFGYGIIKMKKAKTGDYAGSEMGLYWQRSDIQRVLYPDVQEICEKAFGDYLSPLQGLIEITSESSSRYRTDRTTAVVSSGRVKFYLFIGDNIALVTIEDKGNTYVTSFRIMREEETKGLKVPAVPPPGGTGIAGTRHKPGKPSYAAVSTVTESGKPEYSKADIQLVFNSDLQGVVQKVFGNYVQALQGVYMLAEQEGYGNTMPFWIEDIPDYDETTVIKDNYCEFTMIVNAKDRIRVTITKEGDQYVTTFRLLKDGEFKVPELAG